MASSGAIAELARLPVQRKVLLFALVGAVLGMGYWKLVYKALDEEVATARAEHTNKVATNKRLADDLPKYEDLRAHMARQHELIERNQAALPNEAEVPAFFETLQRKVAESGVEIRRWTNRSEEPVESFVKVPVEIELTGTFMQIKRFFASLIEHDRRPAQTSGDPAREVHEREVHEREVHEREVHERIVSIENLALTSPTVKNRELILTAKFTAVTFRKEDKPAAPDKPANGQPAAGAARPGAQAPPATSPPAAPPPLPSAATPAGARARVDQSLDKADARNRNAGGVGEAKLPAAGSERLKGGL